MKKITLLLFIVSFSSCNHKEVALLSANKCQNEYIEHNESEKLTLSCQKGIEYLLRSKGSRDIPSFNSFLKMHRQATIKCQKNMSTEKDFEACKRGIQIFGKIYNKEHLNTTIGGEIIINYGDNIASDNRAKVYLSIGKNSTVNGDLVLNF